MSRKVAYGRMGKMEISTLDTNTIKIKGKHTSLVIDPSKTISKTAADAVLLLNGTQYFDQKVEGSRLLIQGPGEYEIGGVKISAFRLGSYLVYDVRMDGVSMFLAQDELMSKQDMLQKSKDTMKDYHIVVLNSKAGGDQSGLPSLSPKVTVFYGEKALEAVKQLGKDEVKPVTKYQTTLDKLPDELEAVILG